MRSAVISDIHANYVPFAVVLADLQHERIDKTVRWEARFKADRNPLKPQRG